MPTTKTKDAKDAAKNPKVDVLDPEIEENYFAKGRAAFEMILAGKEVENQEALKLIFFFMFNCQKKIDKLIEGKEIRDQKITQLEDHINHLEHRLARIECKEVETILTFRKVPLHVDAVASGNETTEQSEQLTREIFEDLQLDFTPWKTYRAPYLKVARGEPPAMKVVLNDLSEVFTVFRRIKLLQDSEHYKNVRISRFIPNCLLKDYNDALFKSFELRTKKSHKTRIKIVDARIKLESKRPRAVAWVEVPKDDWLPKEEEKEKK